MTKMKISSICVHEPIYNFEVEGHFFPRVLLQCVHRSELRITSAEFQPTAFLCVHYDAVTNIN